MEIWCLVTLSSFIDAENYFRLRSNSSRAELTVEKTKLKIWSNFHLHGNTEHVKNTEG